MGLITDQTGELNIIALAKLWLNCPKKYAIVFVTSHYHSRFYAFYAFSLTSASLESTLLISCSLHKVSPPICVSIWRGSRGLPPPLKLPLAWQNWSPLLPQAQCLSLPGCDYRWHCYYFYYSYYYYHQYFNDYRCAAMHNHLWSAVCG